MSRKNHGHQVVAVASAALSGRRVLWQLGVPLLLLAACGGRGRGDARQSWADESTVSDSSTQSSDETSATGSNTSAGTEETSGTATAPGPTTEEPSGTTAPTPSTGNSSETSTAPESRTNDDSSSSRPHVSDEPTTSPPTLSDAEPAPGLVADDCVPRLGRESSDKCAMGTKCADYTEWVECSLSSSGRWNCQCSFNNEERVYEVRDVQGVDACAVASRFCTENELDLGDEVCEVESTLLDQGRAGIACERSVTCGRSVALDPEVGASVRLVDINQASCWPKANGRYECTCLSQPLDEFHDVEADSPTAACAVSSAYCLEGPQPTDAAETCTIDGSSSDEDTCRVWEICSVPVASLDGATAYAHSSRTGGCDPKENEKSTCHCYSNERTFSFEVPTPEASCETTRQACTSHSEILPTGDVSCQATSQSTSTGSCSVDLDCLQPASVGGRPIAAQGRLTVYCSQPTPSDPWRCSCGSAETFAVFEYGAPEQSAREVCSAAPQGCMEQMTVHLGSYGAYQYPPDPWHP